MLFPPITSIFFLWNDDALTGVLFVSTAHLRLHFLKQQFLSRALHHTGYEKPAPASTADFLQTGEHRVCQLYSQQIYQRFPSTLLSWFVFHHLLREQQ